jgi:hypothetical protein
VIGENRNPNFNYNEMHCIEVITPEIAHELKEGSISFMIYAYPPKVKELPANDGGAAIKRRMTIKAQQRGDFGIDEEPVVLGKDKEG